jgi:prepilin-type N-terminal cleavage/methylation domain-containing protein
MRILRPLVRATRAGFTLVELLAVILIISILMIFLLPKIPEAMDQAEVTACKKNMTEIYSGFTIYQSKFQKAPSKSGVKFFTELISLGVWENTQASVKKLNCPGVGDPTGPGDLPKEQWYEDLEQLDGTWSTYAGRDCKQHPLRKLQSGKEPLVADDNDGGPNHRTTTVVLYGDGTPMTYEQKLLEQQGVLAKDELLQVGAGSQVEDLRKLSLD